MPIKNMLGRENTVHFFHYKHLQHCYVDHISRASHLTQCRGGSFFRNRNHATLIAQKKGQRKNTEKMLLNCISYSLYTMIGLEANDKFM